MSVLKELWVQKCAWVSVSMIQDHFIVTAIQDIP